jgi:hypothetical protein
MEACSKLGAAPCSSSTLRGGWLTGLETPYREGTYGLISSSEASTPRLTKVTTCMSLKSALGLSPRPSQLSFGVRRRTFRLRVRSSGDRAGREGCRRVRGRGRPSRVRFTVAARLEAARIRTTRASCSSAPPSTADRPLDAAPSCSSRGQWGIGGPRPVATRDGPPTPELSLPISLVACTNRPHPDAGENRWRMESVMRRV